VHRQHPHNHCIMKGSKRRKVDSKPQVRKRVDLIGFQKGSHAVVSGASGCGKTKYVTDMLLSRGVHTGRGVPWDAVVVLCDTISLGQPLYEELNSKFAGKGGVTFMEGLPIGVIEDEDGEPVDKEEEFLQLLRDNKKKGYHTMCIIDDLMMSSKVGAADRFVTKCFTSLRHLNTDMWELNQAHVAARERRLQCGYLVCFDTPADQKSLQAIAAQIRPETKGRDIMAAYRTAIEGHDRHGCLVICLRADKDIMFRNTAMDQCFDLNAAPVDEDGSVLLGSKLY